MSGLRRSIATLRADVAALRAARTNGWSVERVDVDGDWLASGWRLTSPAGDVVFMGDQAPTGADWCARFAHLRGQR